MKSYHNMIEVLKSKIQNNELRYKGSIIIGDNSTGKSDLLRVLIQDDIERYCFIDSVNRTLDYTICSSDDVSKNVYSQLVQRRTEENYFNKEDIFLLDNVSAKIERIYDNYKPQTERLFYELTGNHLSIEQEKNAVDENVHILKINQEKIESLSSGYQAILRIFLELTFFIETLKDRKREHTIIIDELEDFLSPQKRANILGFLEANFEAEFIITTHSIELIASAQNYNLIVLNGTNYECLNVNDYNTITDVSQILEDVDSKNGTNKLSDIDFLLRNLFNLKLQGTWTDVEDRQFNAIQENLLKSTTQQLLYKQMKNW